MSITSILLHVGAETLETERGPAAYALGLAKACAANLKALVFQLDVSSPRPAYVEPEPGSSDAGIEQRNQQAVDRAESFRQTAVALGVHADLVTSRSYAYTIPHLVADQARLADLTVLGTDDTRLLSERAIAEYTLFQAGSPLIVVPQGFAGAFACERVTVAWDYGRSAARALLDSLPLLRRATEVTVVTVGGDKVFDTSLTSSQVIASLHRRGINARFAQVERRDRAIGDVVQQFAAENGAQLLVMGGYGHSRFRDFVLGGATRQILDAPRLPTLLSH